MVCSSYIILSFFSCIILSIICVGSSELYGVILVLWSCFDWNYNWKNTKWRFTLNVLMGIHFLDYIWIGKQTISNNYLDYKHEKCLWTKSYFMKFCAELRKLQVNYHVPMHPSGILAITLSILHMTQWYLYHQKATMFAFWQV